MSDYFVGSSLTGEVVPEHLDALKNEMCRVTVYYPDDKKYAEIAFALIKVGQGDAQALAEVVAYIQRQHLDLQEANEKLEKLTRFVVNWMYWAKNWTMRKPENPPNAKTNV